jgi:hypothetical protein
MSLSCTSRRLPLLITALLFLVGGAPVAQAATDHKDFKNSKAEDCRDCHASSGVIDSHSSPTFAKEHRLLAQKATSNCGDCHKPSYCLDCHSGGNIDVDLEKTFSRRGEYMPKTHAADFISTHPVQAASDPTSCNRCHQAKFCSDCHTRQISNNRAGMNIRDHRVIFSSPGVPDPTWVATHRASARRNLQSCQGCHPQKSDCTNFACHPGLGGR